MATRQPAATNIFKIIVNSQQVDLVVTARGNEYKSEYLSSTAGAPTPDNYELSKLVPATIRTWLNVWQAVQDESYTLPDDAKSACDSVGIAPSEHDPYVTIWNRDLNGLSITVHSWSNGQATLDTVVQHQTGLHMFHQYASKLGVEVVGEQKQPSNTSPSSSSIPALGSTTPPPVEQDKIVDMPLPDKHFRASRRLDDKTIMIETGKRDNPTWKEVKLAGERFEFDKVQYADGDLVAYPISGALEVRTTMDSVQAIIPTDYGRHSFWRNKKRDSDEQSYDWQTFESELFKLGYPNDKLVPGFKAWAHGYVIIKMAHSKGKEYANLYGFRALPDMQKAANQ